MKLKFQNARPGVRPTEYEVSADGTPIGTVRQKKDSYSGMGMGTYTSWTAAVPSGERVRQTGTYSDKAFELTDFKGQTKFSTRAEAAEALAILAGVEV